MGGRSKRSYEWERKQAYLMFIPAFLIVLSIIVFPFGYCIYLSLFDYNLDMPALGMRFTGLGNYYKMIFDPRVLNGLKVSFQLIAEALTLEFLLGFAVAILIYYRKFRGEKIVRISLIIPMVIPPVVVGLVWKMLYNPDFGIINYYLKRLGFNPPAWLGDPNWVIHAIAIVDTWQWFPLVALILLAGLDSIPIELVEAARVDGASYLSMVRHIFIPLLKPLIALALILRLMDVLRMFDTIYVMTGGGPGVASETLHFYAYKIGLSHGGYISYAAAIAIVLLFMIEFLSTGVLKTFKIGGEER